MAAGGVVAILIAATVVLSLGQPTKAASYSIDGKQLLDGISNFSTINTSKDGAISLQAGDLGEWHGYDGMSMIPDLGAYYDTGLIYGPNKTLYLMSYGTSCRFRTYSIELQTWSDLTPPPILCTDGMSLVYDQERYLYYLPGGDVPSFFRYDIATDTWTTLPDAPATISRRGDATFVPSGAGAIYVFRGGTSAMMLQYDISTKTWTQKAPFPNSGNIDFGLTLTWDGSGGIYAQRNNSTEFKKYTLLTDSWSTAPSPPSIGSQYNDLMALSGKLYSIQLDYSGTTSGGERTYLSVLDLTTQSWAQLELPPHGYSQDPSPVITSDGQDTLYTISGTNPRAIYRYTISANSWNNPDNLGPHDSDFSSIYHGQPIFDGDHTVYYSTGYSQNSFDALFKLDLNTHEATAINTYPATAETHVGFSGVYFNNNLYLTSYSNTYSFVKYDIQNDNWILLPDLPVRAYYGMALVDGGDGFIYASFGGGSRSFYRFNEAIGWQQMPDMPLGVNHTSGSMTKIGNYLYHLAGGSDYRIMRFDLSNKQWLILDTTTPNGNLEYGSAMIGDGNQYLYVVPSNRLEGQARRFYRYDIVNNKWKRMADLPAQVNLMSAGFYNAGNDRLYFAPSIALPYLWHWTPTADTYVAKGSWYSKTLDLTQVQNWNAIQATSSGSGTVTIFTRSSATGRIWSEWQEVVSNVVASPLNPYWQLRVDLQGNGSTTPTISGISLQYSQEITAPTLPSQFSARGTKDGEVLSSGQTYEYQHPYFSWQGATDGSNGSGVAGYYVYFGEDSNADPETKGNYQTNTDYTVTTAMSAGSVTYLRLKVKDKLGNVSDAATYFSYRYFYISPPGSILKTTKDEFAQGENSLVDLNSIDGSLRLRQQPGGSWSTGPIQPLPDGTYGGAAQVVGNYLYVLRGNNTSTFWRYHLVNQIWEPLSDTPDTINSGSAMTWDGDRYLYVMRGNTTANFYRYDIQNATWSSLPNLPVQARAGSDIEYLGNGVLAFIFAGTTDFYLYDIASAAFETKTSMPVTVDPSRAGAGLWYDGHGLLYAYLGQFYLQGNVYRENMVVYSMQNDSWKTLARPPSNTYYPENNLVGDGQGNLYIFGNDLAFGGSPHTMASKYSIAKDTWQNIPDFNAMVVRGTVASDNNRYIYIIPSTGGGDVRLIRYDTWNNKFSPPGLQIDAYKRLPWDEVERSNWSVENATTAAFDGQDTLYAFSYSESVASRFIAYRISSGETTYLPPAPIVGNNGSMAYMDGYIYYMPALSTTYFFRYNIGTQTWDRMTNLPASGYKPGAQTLIAATDGKIYALRGNNPQFYQYTPNSGGGSWSTLANIPGNPQHGSAIYDSTNNDIYVLRANYSNDFYRYDIDTNSWSVLADFPQNISYGESMAIKDGAIYASAGVGSAKMFIYSLAGDAWTNGTDAPEQFTSGSLIIKVDEQRALVFSHGSPGLWQFNFPAADRGFNGLATHTSQPIQIEGLYDYATLKAEAEIPDNTAVEMWTRTSADGDTWDDWKLADQAKYYGGQLSTHVTSTPRKFTQIKLILYSYDNVFTPTVDSYALDYYFDTDPPTNPSIMTPYTDATKSTELLNNRWYNFAKPVLDWPDPGQAGGATDGELGSHVKGYWVYFGTDETALPETAGQFVTETQFEANLTQSNVYYLRIQAQDETGNIDPNVFAPFIYKFDNTPPENPPFISVTPSGYTAKNIYTFQWPNASDAHSGIAAYCYRTGATTGAFSTETCTTDLHLDNVPAAYLSGTNVFYIRTKDVAGNYASSSAQASFYYSTDPPGPVQNLRAIPPVSAQNLFAYTWELPAVFAGDPDRLTYCYSINELPTSINTTCTTDKFIQAFKAATQQGTNIIYMVAKDEANNVNWNNYASANFIANTVSPGIPLNLVATDSSDRNTNRWSLTLTWTKPTFEGNGVDHYIVERSEDNHTFESLGTVSTAAFVDLTVAPEKIYYYRVRASDNVDNTGGPSGIVSQQAQGRFVSPPEIVSAPVVRAGFDQADVSWVTSRGSSSFVYYGTKPNDLQQSKGSLDDVSEHHVTITGLSPSTVYYYKVQSFDADRNYSLADSYSQIYTFRTSETARIYEVRSSDITLSAAIIQWQTSVGTKTKVEYGTNTDYGLQQEAEDDGLVRSHFMRLVGLQSGTQYHYRVVATTEFGSVINSDDYTFTTVPLPKVSNVRFQPLLDRPTIAVAVTWTTNVPTDSFITYSAVGLTKEEASGELTTDHRLELSDLAGSAEYLVSVRGRDRYGNLATADNQRWTSQVDTRVPTIDNVSVDVATMGAWGNGKAQMIVSWHTDEPSSSQIEYRAASADKSTTTTLDPEPKTNHVVVISNLDLAQIYRIKPISRDISGNTAYGQEVTAVTPDSQNSLLDIILKTLQSILGQ